MKGLSAYDQRFIKIARRSKQPVYVYAQSAIRRNFKRLQQSLPKGFKILYALKANPNPAVCRFMKRLGAGADIASAGELRAAGKAGFKANHISFAGPAKSAEEIRAAVSRGIESINVESLAELETAERIARRVGKKANVSVRINPKDSGMTGLRMGGRPSQFGIDEEELPAFFRLLMQQKHIRFKGIHVYTHSQVLDHRILVSEFENVLKLALAVQTLFREPLKCINFGGGFGIPYFDKDKEINLRQFGAGLKRLWRSHHVAQKFPATAFYVESGRYLAGDAGVYLARVVAKKETRGKTFVITSGGINHHLVAAGGLGPMIRRNYKMEILNKAARPRSEIVTVAGPCCTPWDILANDIKLQKSEPGDILAVYNSGAYGLSASPLKFLGHAPPNEMLIP